MPSHPRSGQSETDTEPQLGLFSAAFSKQAPKRHHDETATSALHEAAIPTPALPPTTTTTPIPKPAVSTAARKRPRSNTGSSLPAWAYGYPKPDHAPAPEPTPASGLFTTRENDAVPTRRQVWTVTDLVAQVRTHIESTWPDLWVHGEISNLRTAPSGHLYFTLKDGESQLPAVLFRREAQLLRFRPEDGLEVLLRGKVSVYEQRGQMQLIAEHLEPVGAGSLQIAFEQLKARLAAEGLFAAARKRALPLYPRCVGIITSPTGAVIRDFLNVANRRHAALDVLLYPAVVQGISAAAEIAAGIAYFNRTRNVDLIVIARGGGSLEDLAPFNTESLARAIAASGLPVVSAIGHETDFTIADFVADLRAPTPSAAAELITAAQHRVAEQVAALAERLARACRYQLILARQRLGALSIEAARARLSESFNRRSQRADTLTFRMEAALRTQLHTSRQRLDRTTSALLRQEPGARLQLLRSRWAALDSRLVRVASTQFQAPRNRHASLLRQLNNLSPLTVLSRGYALVFDSAGTLVKRADDASPGQRLTLRLGEGQLRTRVENEP